MAKKKRARKPVARREHGRIYFWTKAQQWSVTDPGNNDLFRARQQLSARGDYLPRDVIGDYLYLVYTCPTTKLAQQKLAAIRAAVRTVPSLWRNEES
jgi:hypothetical protein